MSALEARVAAVEARQRAYGMHDLGCPAFVPFGQEAGFLGAAISGFMRDQCVCWLADPASVCGGCGHRWERHESGHCFQGASAMGSPVEGRFQLACACAAVAA